jgi:hypothetical protein
MTVLVEIDPLKPKELYDVRLKRNHDDLQWWGRGVKKITVKFESGGNGKDVDTMNSSIKGTSTLPKIGKGAHKNLSGGALRFEYTLEVIYPAGRLLIDPEVIIEP